MPVAKIWFNRGLSTVRDALSMIAGDRLPGLSLLASHVDPLSPVLAAADDGFLEPVCDTATPEGAASYLAFCLETCRARRVDFFLVQGQSRLMADRGAEFAAIGTRLVVSGDSVTLGLLRDKARFAEAAAGLGLPVPETIEIRGPEAFDAAVARLRAEGREACVKPPAGVFGAGFWRLAETGLLGCLLDPDARRMPAATLRAALAETPDRRLLVMEYLAGTEWSVDCLCAGGETLAAIARRKLGGVQRIETVGPVLDLAARAVAAFGLSGIVNVQFRAISGETDPRLLEINPRMSGGLIYTRASGLNLPWWQVALLTGARRPEEMPRPRPALVAPVTGCVTLAAGDPAPVTDPAPTG